MTCNLVCLPIYTNYCQAVETCWHRYQTAAKPLMPAVRRNNIQKPQLYFQQYNEPVCFACKQPIRKKLKMVIANLILVIVSYLGQLGLLILAHFLYYPTH